jgi:hypothetical protein
LRKWHGNPAVVFAGQGGDAQPTVSPKRFPISKANYGRAFFDSIDPDRTSRMAGSQRRALLSRKLKKYLPGRL